MEKIIIFLGRSYILFGFAVGIFSYYSFIRQYKFVKSSFVNHSDKTKNKEYLKGEKMVYIKSNITQYIDTNEVNKIMNYPIINFINTEEKDSFVLTEPRTIIGRSKTDDIIIDDPKVSRSHFVIIKRKGKYFLELSAQKNPISINGRKITEKSKELHNGDTIDLINSGVLFKFNLSNG